MSKKRRMRIVWISLAALLILLVARAIHVFCFSAESRPIVSRETTRLTGPLNEDGTINQLKTTRLLREAYRRGVNYFDTAQGYAGGGSEVALAHGVKPFRDKVVLSTKDPIRQDDTRKAWRERRLAEDGH